MLFDQLYTQGPVVVMLFIFSSGFETVSHKMSYRVT